MFNVRIPLPFLRLHVIPAATSFRQLNSFTRERGRIHVRFYNSRSILLKPFNSCPPFVYTSPSFITRTKKSFTSLAAQTIPDSIDEEKGDQKERYKDHRPKYTKSPINYHVSDGIPLGSIVRVLCTHSEPIKWAPWSAGSNVYDSSSSGLIIPCERKVITNAHCVEHHAQVKLQKHGSTKKYTATVLAVATECDCALMTVVDEEFWEGVPMVEFSDSLKRSDAVNVVGFPSGRDTTSPTRGVVMFQDTIEYLQSSMSLPGFQIDASVNPGNSGGPIFDYNGKCVGLAFQGMTSMKRNDVIPASVISHLIQDYKKNETYTGFPYLGVKWQELKDPVLRQAMEMESDRTGVLITSIEPTSPECKVLKKSDVLLSFDGARIANDGTVLINGDPINFSYIVSQKYCGETVRVEVLRDSQVLQFDIRLASHKRRILSNIKNRPVSYYTIAGLVFTTISDTYLCSQFGHNYESTSPNELLEKLEQTAISSDTELVILSQILPADINQGYGDDLENLEVSAVNGMVVPNFRTLVELVENCQEKFLKFEFKNKKKIVLRTEEAKASNSDILRKYDIQSDRTEDLLQGKQE